jgi:tetratricopeptide (TPR) repeat protein
MRTRTFIICATMLVTQLSGFSAIAHNQSPSIPPPVISPPPASVIDQSQEPLSLLDAVLMVEIAYVCAATDRYEEAITLYTRALPSIATNIGATSRLYAEINAAIALCYLRTGQLASAEEFGEVALKVADSCKHCNDEDFSVFCNNLGLVKHRLRKFEAELLYRRALTHLKVMEPQDELAIAFVEANIGDLEVRRGDKKSAFARYKHALQVARKYRAKDAEKEIRAKIARANQKPTVAAKEKP